MAVGIDDVEISASCDFAKSTTWTVYTSYTILDGSRARADVAVLSADSALALTINGINFAKLRFKRLRKLLGVANEGNDSRGSKPEVDVSSPSPDESRNDAKAEPSRDEIAGIDRRLRDLLDSVLELSDGVIPSDVPMADLGMDSLGAAEIIDALQSKFKVEEDLSALPEMTFESLCSMLGASHSSPDGYTPAESVTTQTNIARDLDPDRHDHEKPALEPDVHSKETRTSAAVAPLTALENSSLTFSRITSERAFSRYWSAVAPRQDELAAVYIVEAFRHLGVNLYDLEPGETTHSPEVLPKHTKVLQRFWQILDQLGIIRIKESSILRTEKPIVLEPAGSLLQKSPHEFPAFSGEFDLMKLTGPQLADCLTGKVDATRILFANSRSQEILRAFYTESPQLACATDLLLDFVGQIVPRKDTDRFRILEVGGGFGGTTASLARLLSSLECSVSYTFTDVSPKLVKAANSKFSMYPWMKFQVLDLESDPTSSFQRNYDLVIGMNVVHATSNIVKSCSRLKDLLRGDGIIALSEVTCKINWYDVVFGLLEGWWCAEDGRDYPLQPPKYWIRVLEDVGFSDCAVSDGQGKEGEAQKIVIGRKASQPPSSVDDYHGKSSSITAQEVSHGMPSRRQQIGPELRKTAESEVATVVYKIVGDLSIHADIIYPKSREPVQARPIGNVS